MVKPVSTNIKIFDGENEYFKLFEELFYILALIQPEKTDATNINHLHAHFRKKALQTFRNLSVSDRKNSLSCCSYFLIKVLWTGNTVYSQA